MKARTLLLGATLAVVLAPAGLLAQVSRARIYSRPEIPSGEVLRRLNLVVQWRGYVPMDGSRDGLMRVVLEGDDMYVLTRSGLVTRLDATTGETRWRARVGKPYTMLPFHAANNRSVYVIANATAFSLDRATGTTKWEYMLRTGISAAPVVDEERVYVPMVSGHINVFLLPFAGAARPDESSSIGSPIYGERTPDNDFRPRPIWQEQTNIELAFRPLQTPEELFVISPSGRAIGFFKTLREGASTTELYRFSTEGKVRVPPTQHAELNDRKELTHVAYIGSDDGNLYAINLSNGRLRWRYTAGHVITESPVAIDRDVFVASEGDGLARVDRFTGEPVWRVPFGRQLLPGNPDAGRFLAANDRFVYANDRSQRLVLLDRKRGIKLSMLDTTAFRFPIVNDVTDRLYLAANDGLIVCLRDRDQVQPIRHRRVIEEAKAPPITTLLEREITETGGKEVSLREALAALRISYGIHFTFALRAFKEAGNPDAPNKPVLIPQSEKRPLKDHLQRILSQVDATYQVVENSLLIVPGKPGAKPEKKPEKDEDKDPDKKPEKDPEKEPDKKPKKK